MESKSSQTARCKVAFDLLIELKVHLPIAFAFLVEVGLHHLGEAMPLQQDRAQVGPWTLGLRDESARRLPADILSLAARLCSHHFS